MTEDEAREWLDRHFGSSALEPLTRFVKMLTDEAGRQNLIARSTADKIWSRHIVDSAQLVRLAPSAGQWVDVGSGGGLPGVVVAILRPEPVVLIEPRRKRVDFLRQACNALGLKSVHVELARAENYRGDNVAVVSARAVAFLDSLFSIATGFSDLSTTFVLPKGRTGSAELAETQKSWQGVFHVERSVTDADAGIIIATGVHRR